MTAPPIRQAPYNKPAKKIGFWESQKLAKLRSYQKQVHKKRIKLDDLSMFTQQLAAMLNAGLPLVNSMDVLKEQTSDPVFGVILQNVKNDVSSGTAFSTAVRKYPNAFPRLFVSLVEAGEASGAMAQLMEKASIYFSESSRLLKKVKSALTYPVVVLLFAFVIVNLLLIFVIPVFTDMYSSFGSKLPVPTQVLVGISHFLNHNIIYLLIGLVILYQVLIRVVRTPRGRVIKDKVLRYIPIVGELLRKVGVSRFTRTFSILMKSGVPIIRSLEICSSASNNTFMENICTDLTRHITQGGQFSEVLDMHPYIPKLVVHMAKAGEQAGDLEGMMLKTSEFYDMEIDRIIVSLTSLIEPLLIVILGVVIGSMVMAMFLPIFNMANIIGQ